MMHGHTYIKGTYVQVGRRDKGLGEISQDLREKGKIYFMGRTCMRSGPGSVVSIATAYGLDVRGSNPGGGEIFRNSPDRP